MHHTPGITPANSQALCSAPHYTKPVTTTPEKPAPFGLRAAWLHFTNERELRQLAKLHMRIERRKAGLADLVEERQRIMNRCIRRMRRAGGKN